MIYQDLQPRFDAKRIKPNPEERLRIAYISLKDSGDRRSWSGTLYNMGRALERHCGDVVRIGSLEPFSVRGRRFVGNTIHRFSGQTLLYLYTTAISKRIARVVETQLCRQPFDVVFAPAASAILPHLRTSIPAVYLSDATVRLMLAYYSDFTGMLPSQIKVADGLERAAIKKASQLVYPSSWAGSSAINDYGAKPSKINIVPFGANLDNPPSREEALRTATGNPCRLLFVGVEWQRKGGEIAFETLLGLERLGIPAELTIVGCAPPDGVRHPKLHARPFLDKNNESDRARLQQLYREADFFILPTRAECFSIALCEACAFGIPILSTRTGGLPELVQHGLNGFLLPLEAHGEQYAARIRDVYTSPSAYQAMRAHSREQFEARLNWDAWGKRMHSIFLNAVAPSREAASTCTEGEVPCAEQPILSTSF
jgi:glycosyltransferase involved in cell wall biosynthesis